jgi:hypothetical protein
MIEPHGKLDHYRPRINLFHPDRHQSFAQSPPNPMARGIDGLNLD